MKKILSFILLCTFIYAPAKAQEYVDALLVLAIDVSQSVDGDEASVQFKGTAQALLHDSVLKSIQSGSYGKIAVATLIWSGMDHQEWVTDWHIVSDKASIRHLAATILAAEQTTDGNTHITPAIAAAVAKIKSAPYIAERFIIDIAGDGTDQGNSQLLENQRRVAEQSGITINGLAIENDEFGLQNYYETQVIVGPGSFAHRISNLNDTHAYQRALKKKLLRELEVIASAN